MNCAALLQSLPLVYSSLELQKEDSFCKDLWDKIQTRQDGAHNFQAHRGLLCYYPKGARRRKWIVPVSLRPMLKYFHDSVLSGHLGTRETFQKTAANIWWPKMRVEIFNYVCRCYLCQRAKPAQDTHVGLHSASPSFQLMDKLLILWAHLPVRSGTIWRSW